MKENHNLVRSFFQHLHTVNQHRFLVCRLCFKMGLYRQGLTHDLSKYSPAEFWLGVKYYQGNRSPIDAERKDRGYSTAWLHHKGRNMHHWQYWTDFHKGQIVQLEMPMNYIKEMICDRIAACMVYQKDKYHPSSALEFLNKSREQHLMPEKTVAIVREMLTIVAENDLDKALEIIKNNY